MFTALLSSAIGRIASGLLLVALIALGYYYINNLNKEKELAQAKTYIEEQRSVMEQDQATIDNQTKVINSLKATEKINDQIRADTKNDTEQLLKKDQTVSQARDKKVIVIQKHYDQLPQTVENNDKRDKEVSAERMSALSAVFCNSSPKALDCPPVVESAASAP